MIRKYLGITGMSLISTDWIRAQLEQAAHGMIARLCLTDAGFGDKTYLVSVMIKDERY